jgi:glycosyltransferase involved in cell wall biosynthesis
MHYPIWANYPETEIYHLSSQNLATLLLFRQPKGKVVVTVHDIIPYMVRNDLQMRTYHTLADQLFDRMAMAGLQRADHLIAVSQYTKHCLVEHLGIAPEKITVVYPGIDHTRFRPMSVPVTVYERYRLAVGRRYLIYVGSEDPRKNLVTLVHALTMLRRELPDIELIKVGRAHLEVERQRLIELAVEVGVGSAIHFLDDVPEDDLPLLYNLAEVCVMPSLYEGFGFPVLEAMACGIPVVCANAASLPEVSGDASLLFETGSAAAENLAVAVLQTLSNDDQQQVMRANGLTRAATFQWSRTARQMLDIYDIEKTNLQV